MDRRPPGGAARQPPIEGRRAALVLVAVEKRGKALGPRAHGGDPGLQSHDDDAFIKQHIAPGSTIYTDGLESVHRLAGRRLHHVPRTQPLPSDLRKGAPSVVPLADRAIGNLQQWLVGTHHGVSRAQLRSTWTSSSFGTIVGGNPWPRFRRCSALELARTPTPYQRIRGARDVAVDHD